MLAMVTAVVCFAVPASAAGFTPLTTLKDDTYVTFRAKETKNAFRYFKISVPASGRITFCIQTGETLKRSTYKLFTASGKTLLSGKLSAIDYKSFRANGKRTFYLKVSLKKGESVKLKYWFDADGSKVTATEEWLKGHTLTVDELRQLKTAFADFVWIGGVYFDEGKITERDALGWLIDGASSSGINPYRFDTKIDYSKENILTAEDDPDHTKYGFWSSVLPAAAVDDTMYHLFGIKVSHTVKAYGTFYYNGFYYFYEGAKGCYDQFEYKSVEPTKDGRLLAKFIYHEFDFDKGDLMDNPVYNDTDVYALISVHETDGKNYIRIHGVYKDTKPNV